MLFRASSPTLARARDDDVRGCGKVGCMAQKLLQYDVLERLGEGARSVIYAVGLLAGTVSAHAEPVRITKGVSGNN